MASGSLPVRSLVSSSLSIRNPSGTEFYPEQPSTVPQNPSNSTRCLAQESAVEMGLSLDNQLRTSDSHQRSESNGSASHSQKIIVRFPARILPISRSNFSGSTH